jgi:hypothetical protein
LRKPGEVVEVMTLYVRKDLPVVLFLGQSSPSASCGGSPQALIVITTLYKCFTKQLNVT